MPPLPCSLAHHQQKYQLTQFHFTGLSSYTVDLSSQTADVYTDDVPFETILEKIKKTGKTVKSAQADGEAKTI